MILILYFTVCAMNFGLFKLGSAIPVDILYISLLLFTLPSYLRQRKLLMSKSFKFVELSWIVFLVYFGARLLADQPLFHVGAVFNLRILRSYMLFFPTVGILNSPKRIKQCMAAGIVLGIIGSVIIIAQSLYGLEPLFAGDWYNMGAWPGNKSMIGPIARVNIPLGNWVVFTFLSLSAVMVVRKNIVLIPFMGFLMVPILITFFRSLWLSIAISVFIQFMIMRRTGSFNVGKFLKIVFGFIACGLLVYYVLPLVGGKDIWLEFGDRILRGSADLRSTSGTFGSRIQTIITGAALFLTQPVYGLGYAFVEDGSMPFLVDIGFVYVSVMLGAIGLVLILSLFATHFFAGIACAKRAMLVNNQGAAIAAITLSAITACLFIYQHWLYAFSTSILSVSSALTFSLLAQTRRAPETPVTPQPVSESAPQ